MSVDDADLHDDSTDAPGLNPQTPLSISQLNAVVKQLLESSLPKLWVAGEVSDLSRPSSGHLYFSLKDQHSQIRAVMWRSTAARLPFKLEDGLSVVCCGGVEVYPPRGSYQLIVQALQPQGVGPLQLAFQQLHQRLSREGLFAAERKRPLPSFPARIGFVTSPSGAALHDFLEAARSLWSDFQLVILPARVQGASAAGEIVNGIRLAQRLDPPLDLLLVGRGGGSIEDLWCFNEEAVVRELAKCTIPTISAVGHEIDVTLSDLVADARALTPTHAAQLALPNRRQLDGQIKQLQHRLHLSMRTRIEGLRQKLQHMTSHTALARPHEIYSQRRQRIDEWDLRVRTAMVSDMRNRGERLASLARASEALSPLNILARGYSLTRLAGSQESVRRADEVAVGDEITTILAAGQLRSRVLSVDNPD